MSIPSNDVVNKAWQGGYVFAQTNENRPKPRVTSMVFEKLLNASPNKYQLQEVKRNLASSIQTKHNLWVTLVQLQRQEFGAFANQTSSCNEVGIKPPKAKTYQLRRMITNKVTIPIDEIMCLQPANEAVVQFLFEEFYAGLHETLASAVEQLLYTGEYIGKLPPKAAFGAPRDFGTLKLLKLDGTLNPAGDLELQLDMNAAGAGQYTMIGNVNAASYALAKKIAVPNLNGYNTAVLDTLEAQQVLMSTIMPTSAYIQGLGLSQPAVVMEDGAVLFVSAPAYANAMAGNGQRFWSQPHPNLPGVWINIIETINTVCEATGRPATTWEGSIVFDLIGKMTCDYEKSVFGGDGITGVYLYETECSDDTLCSLESRTSALPNFVKSFDETCDVDMVCAADASCNVNLFVGYQRIGEDLYLVANAVSTPSAGATPATTFEWSLNGVVQSEISNVFLYNTALLANGDTISVTGADSLACSQTAEYVVADLVQNCGTMLGVFDGSPVLSGGTINLGNVNQNTAKSIVVSLTASGANIDISAANYVGDGVALTATPTIPATLLDGGAALDLELDLDTTTLGAGAATVTVTHDGCDGEFTYIVNFTVV